jgi:orotate phosphoribosyltransferase
VARKDIEQLHALMQSALKHNGPYPLSSGIVSKYYYDGKLRTLDPPTAWAIGNVLLDVIVDSKAEAVGGLAIGSIPIADAVGLAAHLRGYYLPTFYVRKEPKSHGTGSQIAQAQLPDGEELLRPGRRVAIVDDVITTGSSIDHAIREVQKRGCEVTVVIALVERHESKGALLGRGYPVLRVFYTDEDGHLFIDEEFVRRAEEATRAGVLSR